MADWNGYDELCTELDIEHSGTDEIDAGNHKIMRALLERIKDLENRQNPEKHN
jgi:hypothetical protein